MREYEPNAKGGAPAFAAQDDDFPTWTVLFLSPPSASTWYADLTENFPLESKCQATKSL